MTLLIVPEFILQTGLVAVRDSIRESLKDTSIVDSKKYLYRLTKGVRFQRYDFWEQSKSIFIKDKGDPKFMDIDLGFDVSRSSPPHIHITLAGDQSNTNSLAVGVGDNYPYFDDQVNQTEVQNIFQRRYKGVYDVVITTDNSNESVMLSHIYRAILTSLIPSFSLAGLENISISKQDLNPYSDLVPKGLYIRAIRVSLEYESRTLQLDKQVQFNFLPPEIEGILTTNF